MDSRIAMAFFGLCAFGSFLAGCSDGKPTTVPVTGEVIYKNAPVEGAEVTFAPDGGALAQGITDAAGKFTLRTFADGDGAIPGNHRVTVVKNVSEPTTPENPYPISKNTLPARYAQPDQSGLTKEVKADGENHFRLELVD
jgi:hypothetical protein